MNKTKAKYPPQGVGEGGVGGRESHMKSDGVDRLKFWKEPLKKGTRNVL